MNYLEMDTQQIIDTLLERDREIQALKHNQKLLVEMLEESNSLLVACAHEKRPWKEIQEQLGMNRAAINTAKEQQK